MAATGKTPILLYGSTTASNVPVAGNLTNSSDGCEIAINVADKNLFFKDSTNAVNTVPIRQSSASSNGWLSSTDWSTFNNKVSSQWTTSGSNIYYSTGNVGIGAAPSYPLHVTNAANADFAITAGDSSYAEIFLGKASSTALTRIRWNNSTSLFDIVTAGSSTFQIDSSANAKVVSGNLVIGTSGKGIDFSATAGTGTSELLADYEEGTWTPTIVGTTTAGTGTYTIQVGRYTKIGNRVYFNLYLSWSAHTGTGNMNISGLPYTSNSTANNLASCSVWSNAIAFAASSYPQFYIANNSTTITMTQTVVGTSANAAVALDTAGSVIVSGTYEV